MLQTEWVLYLVEKHLAGKHNQLAHAGDKVSKQDEQAKRVTSILMMDEIRPLLGNPVTRSTIIDGVKQLAKKYTPEDIRRDADKLQKTNEQLAALKQGVATAIKISSIPLGFVAPIAANYFFSRSMDTAQLQHAGKKILGSHDEDVLLHTGTPEAEKLGKIKMQYDAEKFKRDETAKWAVGLFGAMYACQFLGNKIEADASKNIIQAFLAKQVSASNRTKEILGEPQIKSATVDLAPLLKEYASRIQELIAVLRVRVSDEEVITLNRIDAVMSAILSRLGVVEKHLAGQHDQKKHARETATRRDTRPTLVKKVTNLLKDPAVASLVRASVILGVAVTVLSTDNSPKRRSMDTISASKKYANNQQRYEDYRMRAYDTYIQKQAEEMGKGSDWDFKRSLAKGLLDPKIKDRGGKEAYAEFMRRDRVRDAFGRFGDLPKEPPVQKSVTQHDDALEALALLEAAVAMSDVQGKLVGNERETLYNRIRSFKEKLFQE